MSNIKLSINYPVSEKIMLPMKPLLTLIAGCIVFNVHAQSSFLRPAFFRGIVGTEAIFTRNTEVQGYRGFGTCLAGGVSFNLPYLSTSLVLGVGAGDYRHRSLSDTQIPEESEGRYTYLFGELGVYGTTNQLKRFSALAGVKCRNATANGGVHEMGFLAAGPSAGVQYRWGRRTQARIIYTYLISPSIMRGQQVSLSLEL